MLPVYDYNITYSPSGMITNKTTTLNGVKTDSRYGYDVPLLRGQGGFTGFEGVSPSLTGGADGSSAQTTWDVGVSPSTDNVRNHQIKTIASKDDTTELTWDADGNLQQMRRCRGVGVSPASNKDGEATVLSTRSHLWNESGQLALFISDDQAGYYGYDGNGERVYKLTGYVHKESYNAGEETTKVMLNDAVLYVNPYFIVTPKGYTKHYYNGSQRLASVVGDISALPDSIVANASERLDNKLAEEYLQTITNTDTLVNVTVDYERDMLYPVLSKEKPQESYVLNDNTYYYRGDHLGSMSWITDGNGDLVEHRSYLPYGEEWYHKKFNEIDYKERYTFTGKERDEESGYDYFGARYFDAGLLTGWLSVDPKWEIDRSRTPYGYCSQNPIVRRDPDGQADYYDVDGNHIMNDGKNDRKVYQQNSNGDKQIGLGVLQNPNFEYKGDVKSLRMSFDGEMRSNNHMADGELSVFQQGDNFEFKRASFEGNSGTQPNNPSRQPQDCLPNGDFTSWGFQIRTDDPRMIRDGVGFSIFLTPLSPDVVRDGFEIHPDGGARGTAGCIGLTGNSTTLNSFINIVKPFYNNKGKVPVNVSILGNPNCLDLSKCK